MKQELSEKWIKASIIGTIWAASEIVLGSFLHNLRVPFSGNILTAIGIIILISISYTWTEKGLFWRAGLICAIMKTMSPSAVIFGPMIAITAEAFLIELFVRLLGRTYAGYTLGAMMAMSWNLFHKIISYIVNYGSNIVDVYTRLLSMAQKQLNMQSDIVWLPIIMLLVIYALFGLFAAIIGIKVGKKMLDQPAVIMSSKQNSINTKPVNNPKKEFNYSLAWLFLDVILVISTFILLNKTSWIIWSISITGIIMIWSFRYKNSLRRISKPKFWVFFVFITLITAVVFSRTGADKVTFLDGLLTGVQMNFRAALLIVGFSVIGTELYNQKIRDFFSKTAFKHLPLALELSAESLPDFIASIPDFKSLIKNPVSVFYNVLSHANIKLSELRKKEKFFQKIFIVTGSKNEGKTTFTQKITEELKKNNLPVGGILAKKIIADSQIMGYDLIDIETNSTYIFLRRDENTGIEKIGKFRINQKGLETGTAILRPEKQHGKKLVIIDEIGALELDNKGWSGCFKKLIISSENNILITVRDTYIEDVIKKWGLTDPVIFKVSEADYLMAAKSIIEKTGS
jgi:nucleoside-triphosphatase THEP1